MAEDTKAPHISGEGEVEWEAAPHGAAIPVLHLDGFEGPLDLLLDLAERQRIDLGRLSITVLAEQFVAALERLVGRVPLERRADWLVLASRLVLLRSRLLCPASPEEAATAEQEAAAELRRLDEMAFARAGAAWLRRRPQLGIDVLARPRPEAPVREGGYVALMEAFLVLLEGRAGRSEEAEPAYRPAPPELWRVPDALARIRALLAAAPEGGELARFLPPIPLDDTHRPLKTRAALASTFVAGLELARAGAAHTAQDATFGAIRLRAAVVRMGLYTKEG